MERKLNKKILQITVVGILSAMVFALSWVRINIPSPADMRSAVHLGNVACLLSGLLFGRMTGGLSAGIGSLLFDFTNPLYIKDAPFTFINKFMMGFVAGALNRKLGLRSIYAKAAVAAVCGQAAYLVLYLGKTFLFNIFLYGLAHEVALLDIATKAVTSGLNAVIAVVCAVMLYALIREVILRTPFRSLLD